MKRAVAAALAILAVLSGCAATDDAAPSITDPIRLVGWWQAHLPGGTTASLRFDAREFALFADCGMVVGSWRASATAIITSIREGDDACDTSLDVVWIEEFASFDAVVGGGFRMFNSSNEVVAIVTQGAPPADLPAELRSRPVVDDLDRRYLRAPQPLPTRARVSDDIVGYFIAGLDDGFGESFVQFGPGGDAISFDGCNTWANGVYRYTASGELLLTWSVVSSSTCEADYRFGEIASAAATDTGLTVFDADGQEIAELFRLSNGLFG